MNEQNDNFFREKDTESPSVTLQIFSSRMCNEGTKLLVILYGASLLLLATFSASVFSIESQSINVLKIILHSTYVDLGLGFLYSIVITGYFMIFMPRKLEKNIPPLSIRNLNDMFRLVISLLVLIGFIGWVYNIDKFQAKFAAYISTLPVEALTYANATCHYAGSNAYVSKMQAASTCADAAILLANRAKTLAAQAMELESR